MTEHGSQKCLVCETTENDTPLVSMTYQAKNKWVCTKCLPELIHGRKSIDDYS
ncbi:MAG: hypothetical protein ACFFD4_06445 [Candidatus Odinarchaeota archaeon]